MAARPGSQAGSDKTFITGVAMNEQIEIPEPAAMERVRDEYKKMKKVVSSLSEKVSIVLSKQERDFLAAYRAHMYNVQKELQDLRNKVAEAETSLQKNDKVHKLEEERSWYRKEALRLDSFTTAMKKDLKYMKEKLESIEDDRNWLERQLKAAKKQNKLLRAELEIRLGENGMVLSDSVLGGALTNGQQQEAPMFPSPSPSYSQEMFAASQGAGAGFGGGKSNRSAGRQSAEGGTDVERQYQKEIRDLKKNLNKEKRDCARLRASVVTNQTSRAELEEFFLRCIESVKRDIGRRRKKAVTKKGAPGGDPSADMDQFTSTDRAKVIERLLEQDEVLAFLYDHLFPPNSGGGGGPSSPQHGQMDSNFGPPIPDGMAHSAGSGANAIRGAQQMPIMADTQAYLNGGNQRPEASF
jgi:hypothetical protein